MRENRHPSFPAEVDELLVQALLAEFSPDTGETAVFRASLFDPAGEFILEFDAAFDVEGGA